MDLTHRFTYNFPTSIRFGAGVLDEVADHLLEHNKKRPLLVTDSFLAQSDMVGMFLSIASEKGLTLTLFFDMDKNPIKSNVKSGVDAYEADACDCIIGLGGGVSMDVARAIALWVNHQDHDLFDFDDAQGGDRFVTNEVPYFICVPTTSGTGSEVGRATVISDDETHEKKILFSPKLMADQVFVDPKLTMGLPSQVTAATGVDALTHLIEAYVAKGFHPICDGIALEGIKLIQQSLVAVTLDPNLESRIKMSAAAMMGAIAFQKGLGIVHSCAHPLSTVFDMHHGLANAIMLPHCVAFNAAKVPEKMEAIARAMGLKHASPAGLIDYLFELNQILKLPKTLSSQGVTTDKIPALVDLAIDDVCHQCNPRVVTKVDFTRLYEQAL